MYSRFRRWNQQGIWEQVFDALLEEAQRRGDLDWDLRHIDSTIVRAHQHAAGALEKGIKATPTLLWTFSGLVSEYKLQRRGGLNPYKLCNLLTANNSNWRDA